MGAEHTTAAVRRDKLTPAQVIELMKKGNQGQYPSAVVLSCIDSRAMYDLETGVATFLA